jgi:hypothetical protein
VLALLLAASALAEMATITTRADDVQLSYGKQRVSLQGNAELIAESAEDPSLRVIIRAELIEGDLATGRFEAVGDVELITTEASLRGASLLYDARTSKYRLTRGAVMVAGERTCGYAYGREMNHEEGIIHIEHGVITTCDHVPPHYAIEARRLHYDLDRSEVTAQDGAVRIYGLRIPLLTSVHYNFGDEPNRLNPIPQVRYGRRDGALLWWGLPYENPDSQVSCRGRVMLTMRRGIRAAVDISGPAGGMTGHIRASYKEDVQADLDEWALIDRRPEFVLERAWGTDLFGGTTLHTELSAGNFKEYEVDARPTVRDRRAMIGLRLTSDEAARRSGVGNWWWVGGRGQLYDEGGDYSVLEAGVGYGTELTDWLTGSLTYSYHYTHGESPFEFDDVDIEQELAGRARIKLDRNWGLGLTGRYDVEARELRDYEVELARRVHCLTWQLKYRDLSESISLGVAINGVFGDAPAQAQRCVADGPPDYWQWRDARGNQQQATE